MAFLADNDRATAIQCFEVGMTVNEVSRRLRLPRGRMQRWLQAGAIARSGWQHEFSLDVLAAQSVYQERILTGLIEQAESPGGVGAVQLALQRLERIQRRQEVEAIPDDELGAKRYRLRDIRRRIVEAGDTAHTKLVREERALMGEIRQLEAEAEQRAQEERGLRALTAEDARERLRLRVDSLADADLTDLLAICQAEHQERGL